MASNGYVRKDCSGCLFYSSDREYGNECRLRNEGFESDGLQWVSANDCDRYPEMKEKYYEPCEHRVSGIEVRQWYRKYFGFGKEN